jgi:hypothetical protein
VEQSTNFATIAGLSPNTYTVTVTDANSCTATGNVTVVAGPVCCVLNLSASITQPTCGATDGSITVSALPQATTLTHGVRVAAPLQQIAIWALALIK